MTDIVGNNHTPTAGPLAVADRTNTYDSVFTGRRIASVINPDAVGSNLNESGRNCDGSPWARRRNLRASIAFGRGWS